MKTLMATAWQSYLVEVVPHDAPPVQVEECRRAFYAGAKSLFSAVLNEASPGDEITAADIDLMEGLAAELDQFAAEVGRGGG